MCNKSPDTVAEVRIANYTKLKLSDVVAIAVVLGYCKNTEIKQSTTENIITLPYTRYASDITVELLTNGAAFEVWFAFGHAYVKERLRDGCFVDEVTEYVKENFIEPIQKIEPSSHKTGDLDHLEAMVKTILSNPKTTSTEALTWLVEVIIRYLDAIIETGRKKALEEDDTRKQIKIATENNKKYVVLNRRNTYVKILTRESDCLFVIFPHNNVWCVKSISSSVHRFVNRKDLPASWAGLKGNALAQACGVYDAAFCHKDRFICAADSREGAIKMAEKAIEHVE